MFCSFAYIATNSEHQNTIKKTLEVSTLEIDDTILGAEVIRLDSKTETVSGEKQEFMKNNLQVNKVPVFENSVGNLFNHLFVKLDQFKK